MTRRTGLGVLSHCLDALTWLEILATCDWVTRGRLSSRCRGGRAWPVLQCRELYRELG